VAFKVRPPSSYSSKKFSSNITLTFVTGLQRVISYYVLELIYNKRSCLLDMRVASPGVATQ
jgi:hypothetical protein